MRCTGGISEKQLSGGNDCYGSSTVRRLHEIKKKDWNLLCIVLMFSLSFGAQAGLEKIIIPHVQGQSWRKEHPNCSGSQWECKKDPLAEGWYDVSLIDMMNEASETGKTEGEVALNHIQESLKRIQ